MHDSDDLGSLTSVQMYTKQHRHHRPEGGFDPNEGQLAVGYSWWRRTVPIRFELHSNVFEWLRSAFRSCSGRVPQGLNISTSRTCLSERAFRGGLARSVRGCCALGPLVGPTFATSFSDLSTLHKVSLPIHLFYTTRIRPSGACIPFSPTHETVGCARRHASPRLAPLSRPVEFLPLDRRADLRALLCGADGFSQI